jgi:hypothetical protein
MKCDSRASLLARTLASLCLGRKPKARVVITTLTTQGGNAMVNTYLLVKNVQHDRPPTHHLQGDGDGGSTSTKMHVMRVATNNTKQQCKK